MVRSCVSWCRHLFYALVILALIGCLTEIGLRVYDSATGQVTRRDLYDRGMVCKSWSVHHSLKPSHRFAVLNRDTGKRAAVTLNGLGLRGPEPVVPKPADVFRIICLGDELTLAPQIDEAETFAARLARELPSVQGKRVEVLNAGVPEYCPLLSYLQTRQQLLSLAPDLLVVNFEMGDVADDYAYRRLAITGPGGEPVSCAHPALNLSAHARPKGKGRSREEVFLFPLWCRQRLQCIWSRQSLGEQTRSIGAPTGRFLWLEDDPPDWSVHVTHALTPIAHLRELITGAGVTVVVAVAPAPWQVSADASNADNVREPVGVEKGALYRSRRPFDAVTEFCAAHGIPCCDLSSAFQQSDQPERLYLTTAAALSSEGHALYARQLAAFLDQQLRSGSPRGAPPTGMSGEFPPPPQALLPSR